MQSFLPDTNEKVLELEQEDLAMFILKYLSAVENNDPTPFNLNNFIGALPQNWGDNKEVSEAFIEAWMWLERELMIAPRPRARDFFFIASRGQETSPSTSG